MRVWLLMTVMLASLMAAQDGDRLRAALDAQIDALDAQWAEAPIAYLEITEVFADSTAASIGLRVGDRLARVDQRPVFLKRDAQPEPRSRVMHWWRSGQWHQERVDPGPVGFQDRSQLDLALWFRRDRGIEDRRLLRAALAWQDHPRLARAELAALDPELQASSSARLLSGLLRIQGDPHGAALDLLALIPELPPEVQNGVGAYLATAALLSGDAELAERAQSLLESIAGLAQRDFVRALTRSLSRSHPAWPLSEQFTDFNRMRYELDVSDSTHYSGWELSRHGAYADGVRRGHYFQAVLAAPRNARLSDSGYRIAFDLRLRPSGSESSPWPPLLWLRLHDTSDRSLVYVNLFEPDADGIMRYRLTLEQVDSMPSFPLAGETLDDWHHVEIWQWRNGIELLIDGLLIGRFAPHLAPQGLELVLHTQGTHSDIRNFIWHEALTRPVAAPAPADPAATP